MAIITKTGDKGTTGIFGGERVPKDDIRIEANGTMDELNAHLGLIRSMLELGSSTHTFIGALQMQMMQMMSLVATRSERRGENPNSFSTEWLTELETTTKQMMDELPDNRSFILPGGTPLSAHIQLGRAVCRRAERRLWTLHRTDPLPDGLIQWVNRLSDYLFVLAKIEMQKQNWPEEVWQAFAYKRKTRPTHD